MKRVIQQKRMVGLRSLLCRACREWERPVRNLEMRNRAPILGVRGKDYVWIKGKERNNKTTDYICCYSVQNLYNFSMKFEWDDTKSLTNKAKHGIDFSTAREMWKDDNRVEIHAPYPLEERSILIGMIGKKLWTAIFAYRGDDVRVISV
jgi:hypothetical protein